MVPVLVLGAGAGAGALCAWWRQFAGADVGCRVAVLVLAL